jgi:putative DNA primase/helicase
MSRVIAPKYHAAEGAPRFCDVRVAARAYIERGWRVVPIRVGSKGPDGIKGWTDLRLTLNDIDERFHHPFLNIGILTGEASGGLADVDLDSREAIQLAELWLPRTGTVFGRPGRGRSHYLYILAENHEELRRQCFKDPLATGEKAMLVELRGNGHQTLAPPSCHPDSGELVEWHVLEEPAHISLAELRRSVARIAAGALIARHLRDGERHDTTLALAGFLLRDGRMTVMEGADFLAGVAMAARWDERDARRIVQDTARRLERGETASGGRHLRDHFPGAVLDTAFSWLRTFGLASGKEESSGPASKDWPEPVDLPPITDPVPTLPPELLPVPLRGWLIDIADRLSIPLEFVTLPAVSAAASVTGRTVAIRPKLCDDWTVVPTLWGADVGGPGTLKSPAVSEATRPLNRLAAKARDDFRLRRAEAESEADLLAVRVRALKDELAAAAKSHEEEEVERLKSALTEVRLDQQETPAERRYLTNDSTIEKLGELLNQNPRGLLVLRDELTGWFYSLEKPGRETDRAFFLESWNGDGSFDVDRIGRGSLHVPALTLSIFGGIQPDRLRSFFSGAMANGGEADGLLQRFQLIAWPDDLGEWRLVDRFPDTEAARRAFRIFERLDRLAPADVGAEPEGDREIPFVRFAPEAQALFYEWWPPLMSRVRSAEGQRTPGFTAHLAKYSSLLPKLALVFHLVGVVDGTAQGAVGLEAAKLAAAWTEFLEPHARKVYAPELKGNVTAAYALAEKILAGAVTDRMTVRDVARREWSGLKSSGGVYAALDVLAPVHWTRVEAEETGGRDRTVIRVNPKLRGAK